MQITDQVAKIKIGPLEGLPFSPCQSTKIDTWYACVTKMLGLLLSSLLLSKVLSHYYVIRPIVCAYLHGSLLALGM